jgi:hypothetical protein
MFVLFSDTILPVNLPSYSQAGDTYEGVQAIVSGWGKTSESKYVEPFRCLSTEFICQNWKY